MAHLGQQVIDFATAALARGRQFVEELWVNESAEMDLGEAAEAVREVARKVAQVALWAARRADLFAPPAGAGRRGKLGEAAVRELQAEAGVAVDPATDMVAHTSIISYPSGHAEGPVTFVLPAIAGRLGPWEQLVYYGVCALYASGRVVQTRDGRLVETSVYELTKMLTNRDDARTLERVRQAIQTLAMTFIAPRSEMLVPARDRGQNNIPNSTKGTKHAGGKANRQPRMERVQVRSIFPMLTEAHFEELTDVEQRPVRGRIWLRLPTVVMQEIDEHVVAFIPIDALRAIGPGREAALRLYAFLRSHRPDSNGRVEISAKTLGHVLRPGAQGRYPSHYRRWVQSLVAQIGQADHDVKCSIESATDRSGGWKLVATFRRP